MSHGGADSEGFTEFELEKTANRIAKTVVLRQRDVVRLPIASLMPGESPRLDGQDAEHVARLAELDEPLPPILVDRRTMRVIDGMHRLLAACLRGQDTIESELFDGTREEAFLRAVEANVTHGLPLSQPDRRAAAARILEAYPEMSDRAIAKASGLGTKSVAAIRRNMNLGEAQPTARIGRDGKIRPLSSAEGRRRAAELITENPGASLREIARRAGISPATVSDVRKRLTSGELAVTERRPVSVPDVDGGLSVAADRVPAQRSVRKVRSVQPDPLELMEKLLRDPSLRHKEEGRHLLRLLQQNALGNQMWAKLAAAVPAHCRNLVVDLARQYAETWTDFAQELDQSIRTMSRDTQLPQERQVGMGA
ncbi:winged helix-turn-helix transcriptional regulator [Kitasatospora sp. NPDC053057]|uniref:ParB/RepB/Spo0J family partition protein n=1 Tax=Kitasatospora sp. NPDC053057 TaxID=3364062 RepID=UPI0037C7F77D